MSDLVERLKARKESRYDSRTQGAEWHDDELCQEAAAEIARLTTELAGARDAALKEAAVVCDVEAADWETRTGNPCKRLKHTILALANVPAGYVCVPVEPTPEMISAAGALASMASWPRPATAYRAMIAAMIAATKEPTP